MTTIKLTEGEELVVVVDGKRFTITLAEDTTFKEGLKGIQVAGVTTIWEKKRNYNTIELY